MLKRNSFFTKLLIPIIIVMMCQTLLISLMLFVNGTINSLGDSAIDFMRQNAENRRITLENTMIFNWSGLDKLESDIVREIDLYLRENGISVSEALGDYGHETDMLYNISGSLIGALRISTSTGVFMYFTGGEEYSEAPRFCRGLYYRDLDPLSTPMNYEDILFLRGAVGIARKDNIQLDSLWNEMFSFSHDTSGAWESFQKPQLAHINYPEASAIDLSYWSAPHFINQDSSLDSNKCITYTRPLFYDGQLIGIIGTEVQLERLERYFPARDFDDSGKSGYMLVVYDGEQTSNDSLNIIVYAVTGSYIKRLASPGSKLTLISTDRAGVYTTTTDGEEKVRIVLQSIRLYNTNAPFSNEQWALAAIGTDSVLFESSRAVSRGILYGSAVAIIAGCILLAFIIRISTKPLLSIAAQIEKSDPDDPIAITDSNINEIVILCDTINEMRDKRNNVEMQLREERERYLIALESAADTFLEYDLLKDSFMIYYFSGEDEKPQLCSRVIDGFIEKIYSGEVCHQEDIRGMAMFMKSKSVEPIEIRARTSLFSHIKGTEPDGDFYWFLFKASRIYGEDGNIRKIIGTAREITREKRKEFARIETSRRDPTTGFYNRDYGIKLLKSRLLSASENGLPFYTSLIRAEGFDDIEAYYGRVFGGVVLMGLSRAILSVITDSDIPVRLNNDEFLVIFHNADKQDNKAKAARFYNGIKDIYIGENTDLRLNASIGAVSSEDADGCDGLIRNVYRAVQCAAKYIGGFIAFYDELPPEARNEAVISRDKPVSINLDISRENIVGFAFELFERSSDVHSTVNILLSVLGGMYSLHQIIVCAYDADFGANQVAYQWNEKGVVPYHAKIEKVTNKDLDDFELLLDENRALLYNDEIAGGRGEGVAKLLCAVPGERFDAYCCVMYENASHTGRILFKTKRGREWADADLLGLYEVTKIIAAHLSVEKSNSASRAKSEFLSRISHEIRTPMNVIIGMTDIAKNSVYMPERLNDCLSKIDFSAKHLLALINDVLEMSRIESGKLSIENRLFSLVGLVSGIDTLMRPSIEAKNITLEINKHNRHDRVIGDEYRLRQVLVNLMGNAGKFTDAGGTIDFSVEEQEDGIFRFSVKDSGVGISSEDQPRIFKAFEQASVNSAAAKRQGTGLGLAISGNIISAMGGKIELNSKPGEGSEFYFTIRLELDETDETALPEEGESISYSGYFAGKRTLLAEDNEINAEIASYILQDAGFEVDVAFNGEEAVNKFFASAPGYYDIILMDIQMPVMDGLMATRTIRKNPERPDARTIPIIAMTANAFDEDMKKSIESGMNGHTAKPIDTEKLYALLARQLNKED